MSTEVQHRTYRITQGDDEFLRVPVRFKGDILPLIDCEQVFTCKQSEAVADENAAFTCLSSDGSIIVEDTLLADSIVIIAAAKTRALTPGIYQVGLKVKLPSGYAETVFHAQLEIAAGITTAI